MANMTLQPDMNSLCYAFNNTQVQYYTNVIQKYVAQTIEQAFLTQPDCKYSLS